LRHRAWKDFGRSKIGREGGGGRVKVKREGGGEETSNATDLGGGETREGYQSIGSNLKSSEKGRRGTGEGGTFVRAICAKKVRGAGSVCYERIGGLSGLWKGVQNKTQ